MIKLKEITRQLNEEAFKKVEDKLVKTKADNFLSVLRAYREGKETEEELIVRLNLNSNSFYVLKCRLYDRIQNELTTQLDPSKSDINAQLEQVYDICYHSSTELAVATLLKLEKDLLAHNMNGELIIVYSALKKLHYDTDKYFFYSQLYNKHVGFWLSLEKVDDILSDFNVILGQYDYSRSKDKKDRLQFLRQKMNNHLVLNPSNQAEIVQNIIDIQLFLFCDIEPSRDIEELLNEALRHIEQLPDSSAQKSWDTALNYLAFEYYTKAMQTKKASDFYEKTNKVIRNLLLFSCISLVSKFLTAKIEHLIANDQKNVLIASYDDELLFSSNNMYSNVQMGIYKSMILYYSGEIKKAISMLNGLLNNFGFRDYFHIEMEIKFTLAFFYFKIKEEDMVESLITSIYRKIKADKESPYLNALDLIKFFNVQLNLKRSDSDKTKGREALTLFFARNKGEFEMLKHLRSELLIII